MRQDLGPLLVGPRQACNVRLNCNAAVFARTPAAGRVFSVEYHVPRLLLFCATKRSRTSSALTL